MLRQQTGGNPADFCPQTAVNLWLRVTEIDLGFGRQHKISPNNTTGDINAVSASGSGEDT